MKQNRIPTKKVEARKSDFTPLEPVQKSSKNMFDKLFNKVFFCLKFPKKSGCNKRKWVLISIGT